MGVPNSQFLTMPFFTVAQAEQFKVSQDVVDVMVSDMIDASLQPRSPPEAPLHICCTTDECSVICCVFDPKFLPLGLI